LNFIQRIIKAFVDTQKHMKNKM